MSHQLSLWALTQGVTLLATISLPVSHQLSLWALTQGVTLLAAISLSVSHQLSLWAPAQGVTLLATISLPVSHQLSLWAPAQWVILWAIYPSQRSITLPMSTHRVSHPISHYIPPCEPQTLPMSTHPVSHPMSHYIPSCEPPHNSFMSILFLLVQYSTVQYINFSIHLLLICKHHSLLSLLMWNKFFSEILLYCTVEAVDLYQIRKNKKNCDSWVGKSKILRII